MMLRAENLTVSYEAEPCRQSVFSGLSFEIMPRQSLALFGESGCGKTTLLNLICGLKRPDTGRVLLDTRDGSVDMASADEARRTAIRRSSMGIVFQFFNLIPTLSLMENCLLPRELGGLPLEAERVEQALVNLGLGDKLEAFPDQISGGEQQRVAVVRALAHDPSLVLADEPTGNLDTKNSRAVADLLWDSVEKAGASLIIATHSAALAERATKVLQMDTLKS